MLKREVRKALNVWYLCTDFTAVHCYHSWSELAATIWFWLWKTCVSHIKSNSFLRRIMGFHSTQYGIPFVVSINVINFFHSMIMTVISIMLNTKWNKQKLRFKAHFFPYLHRKLKDKHIVRKSVKLFLKSGCFTVSETCKLSFRLLLWSLKGHIIWRWTCCSN